MKDDLSAGYNDLSTYIQDSKASLTLSKNDITQMGANSPKGLILINHLDRNISFLNWWISSCTDEIHDATSQLALTKDLPSNLSPRAGFYLLGRHPLLRGRIRFVINMRMQITGILAAYKTGLFNAAHLYNATLSGQMTMDSPADISDDKNVPQWPDMECFISFQGSDNIFFRDPRPKSLNGCAKRYATAIDKKQHMKTSDMITVAGVSDILYKQYCNQGWSIDDIKYIMNGFHQHEQFNKFSNFLHSKRENTEDVSIISFLDSLRQDMTAESPKLAFDYLSMHRKLFQLLIEIKNNIIERSKEDLVNFGLDGLAPWNMFPRPDLISLDDFNAPFFVGSMLWGIWVLGSPGMRKDHWKAIFRILAEHHHPWHFCIAKFTNTVPKILEEQIYREGGLETKKANAKSTLE